MRDVDSNSNELSDAMTTQEKMKFVDFKKVFETIFFASDENVKSLRMLQKKKKTKKKKVDGALEIYFFCRFVLFYSQENHETDAS